MLDDLDVAVADEEGRAVEGLQDLSPSTVILEGDVLETLTRDGVISEVFLLS